MTNMFAHTTITTTAVVTVAGMPCADMVCCPATGVSVP